MKNLINETVEHKKFGEGTIILVNHDNIIVRFDDTVGEKNFQYPDAFESYLTIHNTIFEKDIFAAIEEKKNETAAKKVLQRLEFEKRMEERRLEKLELVQSRKKKSK